MGRSTSRCCWAVSEQQPSQPEPESRLDALAAEKLRRAKMLVGILEDLPHTSESRSVVHDEILRARLEADHARRLAEHLDS